MADRFGDVSVALDNHVALAEIHRPPHNYFDHQLIADLADAFERLDDEPECRAIVLASEGKSFCAGADFAQSEEPGGNEIRSGRARDLYVQAVRLFACQKPV